MNPYIAMAKAFGNYSLDSIGELKIKRALIAVLCRRFSPMSYKVKWSKVCGRF
jgi:hypothetical protein